MKTALNIMERKKNGICRIGAKHDRQNGNETKGILDLKGTEKRERTGHCIISPEVIQCSEKNHFDSPSRPTERRPHFSILPAR
jgi:hypothetical protein